MGIKWLEQAKDFSIFDSGVRDINRKFIFATNDGIDMLSN